MLGVVSSSRRIFQRLASACGPPTGEKGARRAMAPRRRGRHPGESDEKGKVREARAPLSRWRTHLLPPVPPSHLSTTTRRAAEHCDAGQAAETPSQGARGVSRSLTAPRKAGGKERRAAGGGHVLPRRGRSTSRRPPYPRVGRAASIPITTSRDFARRSSPTPHYVVSVAESWTPASTDWPVRHPSASACSLVTRIGARLRIGACAGAEADVVRILIASMASPSRLPDTIPPHDQPPHRRLRRAGDVVRGAEAVSCVRACVRACVRGPCIVSY